MVVLGVVMAMLSVGSVTSAFGIYVTPVSKDMGLSLTQMNSGLALLHLGSALAAPFAGRLLDRFSIRWIVALGGIGLGGSLILLGIGTALLPKALLILFPLSFGFQLAGSIASYVLVARWFRLHRGRAMALVAIGQTLPSIVMAPAIAALIQRFGWRTAVEIQGASVLLLLLLIAYLIVDRPGEGEHEPRGKAVATIAPSEEVEHYGAPLPYRAIVSSPVFWLLAAITAVTLAVVQAVLASLVPLANSRGLSLVQATTLLSSLGVSGIVGKLTLAYIADKVDRRILLSLALLLILGFLVSLTMDWGSTGLLVACLMCGVALGGFFPIYSAMLSDRFGGSSLGTTEGLVGPMIAVSAAGAVMLVGKSHDATGSYTEVFLIFSGLIAFTFVLSLFLWVNTKTVVRTQPAGVAA